MVICLVAVVLSVIVILLQLIVDLAAVVVAAAAAVAAALAVVLPVGIQIQMVLLNLHLGLVEEKGAMEVEKLLEVHQVDLVVLVVVMVHTENVLFFGLRLWMVVV